MPGQIRPIRVRGEMARQAILGTTEPHFEKCPQSSTRPRPVNRTSCFRRGAAPCHHGGARGECRDRDGGERLPVTASLLAVADGLAGAGQATAGPCLLVLVTDLERQGQRGGVPGTGLAGLARGEERLAETVERLSLAGAVAGLAVEAQRLPEVAGGLHVTALPQLAHAQAGQRPGLAEPAADLAAKPQGPPEVDGSLPVAALPQLEFAEVAQREGLAWAAAGVAEERQ